MRKTARQLIPAAMILIVGFVLVFVLSGFLERNRVVLPFGYEDADLALQGKRLKGYALGSEGLLADWYWMQSLQYIGNKLDKSDSDFINIEDLRSLNPRLLYPYLDNATDLDPQFTAAYTYGAIVLPAIDPNQAIRLTEKGIANNPVEWRLYQYLGYIHWRLKQYDEASKVYEKGSQIEGSGKFMKVMAALMQSEAGSRDTARAIYLQMLEDETTDQQTRITAEFRLMELDSFDQRDAIRSALRKAKENTGKCPRSLADVVPLLKGVQLPNGKDFTIDGSNNLTDPSGAPYILDQDTCDVKLDPDHTKLPVR